jgi:hypothetical protein
VTAEQVLQALVVQFVGAPSTRVTSSAIAVRRGSVGVDTVEQRDGFRDQLGGIDDGTPISCISGSKLFCSNSGWS